MRRVTNVALNPAVVRAPDALGSPFTLGVWASGAPLTTDPSPNVTPPSAARILLIDPKARGAVVIGGLGIVRCVAIGGVSIQYQVWFYDPTRSQWIKLSAARTITMATTNIDMAANFNVGSVTGAQVFLQITAVNAVTNFGYGYT